MSQENEVMASEEKQEVTEAKFDGAVADGSSLGGVENLGGPTPQNSKPDDESNKLKTPSQTQAASPKTNLPMLHLRSTNQLKQKMLKAMILLRSTFLLMLLLLQKAKTFLRSSKLKQQLSLKLLSYQD